MELFEDALERVRRMGGPRSRERTWDNFEIPRSSGLPDGDVTDDGANSYLYDAEGRICAVRSDLTQAATGYLYDGNGIRVAKGTLTTFSCDFTSNGFSQTNLYVQGLQGEQLQESDSSFNLLHFNVFLGSTVLATYAGSGYQQANWHYSLNDWVGTRRVQANAEGVTEGTFMTMPFGDVNAHLELTPFRSFRIDPGIGSF